MEATPAVVNPASDNPTPSPTMFVFNHDIAGLYLRLNRVITELIGAASASVNSMNPFDQARLAQYIAAIRSYLAWVNAVPQLDLPETCKRTYGLESPPVVPELENDSTRDMVRLVELARDELISGQSARMPSGLIPFDSNRFAAVINKVEAFLVNYIQKTLPLDLPESSPTLPVTASGKTGV